MALVETFDRQGRRIADMGVSWDVPREAEFAPLAKRADIQRVLVRLDENQHRVTGARRREGCYVAMRS